MDILTTDGYLGVAKQAAFGTPVAPAAGLFIKYLSESLGNEQSDIKAQEGGFGRWITDVYKSSHIVKGDVSFYCRPDVAGFFLAMALGADAYVAGPPEVHTLTPVEPHFFTIARGIDPATPTLIERFQDCVISDLTIEGESSQPWKVTATILGTKGVKQVAADTPTYEANEPLMFFDTPVYTLAAGGITNIDKFSIKISNNIEEWYGTTITPAAWIVKLMTIEVGFTLKFASAVHYANVYYGGGTAIVDTIYAGNFKAKAGYGAGATERSLEIELKNIRHIAAPVNIAGEAGAIFQECVGYAYQTGADNLIDVIVKNTYAADYDA